MQPLPQTSSNTTFPVDRKYLRFPKRNMYKNNFHLFIKIFIIVIFLPGYSPGGPTQFLPRLETLRTIIAAPVRIRQFQLCTISVKRKNKYLRMSLTKPMRFPFESASRLADNLRIIRFWFMLQKATGNYKSRSSEDNRRFRSLESGEIMRYFGAILLSR